ncbi:MULTISPECIES: DUF3247 family protein [unclassified Lysobacter]
MRIAPRVYTAQYDIDRLQAMIFELPNDEHVQLTLDDGRVLSGVIAGRPMTMQFFDPNGVEGTNGTVRLEQPALEHPEQARWVDLFLDQIVEVRHLDRHELAARPAAGASDSVHSSRTE